jgi:hypothetical protein
MMAIQSVKVKRKIVVERMIIWVLDGFFRVRMNMRLERQRKNMSKGKLSRNRIKIDEAREKEIRIRILMLLLMVIFRKFSILINKRYIIIVDSMSSVRLDICSVILGFMWRYWEIFRM